MKTWLKHNWQFILFCLLAISARFIHYDQFLYFIYDMGRDATVLKSIAEGDFTLVGPTTGLPGFFLGPLWYYIGLPGYFLSAGNPYGIQLWYISLSLMYVPLAWILSHRLFEKTVWAKISAILLVICCGSISGSTFVWNPMLSLPLLAGIFLCLMESRQSKKLIYLGFLLLALMLQSEFAYAIFFIVTLWFLIPWLRGKFEWKTMLVSALIVAITLIPQFGFEVRHNFIMTKSLIASMTDQSMKVSQASLWSHRPQALWEATIQFLSRDLSLNTAIALGLIATLWFSLYGTIKSRKFVFQLLLFLTLLPYLFYLFWRGNYGHFFDYYITPHFILFIPLLVLGMKTFYELFPSNKYKVVAASLLSCFLLLLGIASFRHWDGTVLRPNNQAGLKVMQTAIEQMYGWNRQDQSERAVFRIYTPNVYTEHYDYLSWWVAQTNSFQLPKTVQSESDQYRSILYEPTSGEFQKLFFIPWYRETTTGFTMTRSEKVGVLTIESWKK